MIRSLRGQNFMSYESLSLAFDQYGLIQIDGEVVDEAHADNNGVGKTAILDLILWTLFGVTRRADKADEIIHSPAGKNCVGEVQLATQAGLLAVTRYRKHDRYKNEVHVFLDGQPVEATDNAAKQARIEALLGMDDKTFMRALIFDGSLSLATMNDNDAKDFLERVLGLDLTSYQIAAKEYAKQCANSAAEWQAKRDNHHTALSTLHNQRNAAIQQQQAWLQSVAVEKETLRRDIAEAHQHVNQHQQHHAAVQAEYNQLNNQLEELRRQLYDHQRLANHIRDADNAVHAARQRLAVVNAAYEHAQQQFTQAHSPSCPTCLQLLPAEAAEHVRQQAARTVADVLITKQLAENALQEAESRRASLSTTPPPDLTALTDLEREVSTRRQQLADHSNQIGAAQQSIHLWTNRLIQLTNDPYTELIRAADEQITQVNVQHAEAVHYLTWWNDHARAADEVVKMFGREGLRSYVLDLLLPYLNQRLHRYLAILTEGAIIGDFKTTTNTGRERFHIDVRRRDGGKSYVSLSQGERARLDLAMVLSVMDYLHTKTPFPVLIFDELFDALDNTGVERVIGILREISQRSLVIIISHNPSIRVHVDRVLWIIKEHGVSRVERSVEAGAGV